MNKFLTALLLTVFFLGLCPVAHSSSVLTQEKAIDSARVNLAKSRSFTLVYGQKKFTASSAQVKKWFKTSSRNESAYIILRPGNIYHYLNTKVSPVINQPGQTSRFKYIAGHLHLIGPGKKGRIVDGVKTSLAIRSAIISGKNSAPIHMKEHRPSVFSDKDFRKLKFPDHLARGETNFTGSPANRVHNIHVATRRFDGLVVMPNEEFSFNRHLGEINDKNGYLPELVIKDNVTTPEYGGGICQVSTTAFRAALAGGMKITQRRNHSYPVQYYGTPGYDATVYAPSTDLTFINDANHSVYITTQIIGTRLIFDIWGTDEGRAVTVNGPFVTARYPDGSLTAAVAQIIKVNGQSIREQNFVSRYQSPNKFPTVRAQNRG